MPGKEIKGTSKIANYRHGGRVKGSGEKMRSPGSKGAPTAKALKESQT